MSSLAPPLASLVLTVLFPAPLVRAASLAVTNVFIQFVLGTLLVLSVAEVGFKTLNPSEASPLISALVMGS